MNTHQNLLVIHLRCLFNIFNLHFYVYIVKQRCCQKHHWLRGTQIICEARAFFFFVWNVISMTNHSDIVARKLPLKSLWFCHGNSRDKIMAFIVLPLIHICEVDFFSVLPMQSAENSMRNNTIHVFSQTTSGIEAVF